MAFSHEKERREKENFFPLFQRIMPLLSLHIVDQNVYVALRTRNRNWTGILKKLESGRGGE
jgi:hypothetical protein